MRIVSSALLCTIMTVASTPLCAQTIKGIVKDQANGQPIPDASVVLLDNKGKIQRGALTELDGSYVIVAPKSGTYSLRVGAAGYETKDVPEFKLNSDQSTDIGVMLVSTTGAGGDLAGFEARRSRGQGEFLTREQIERRGSSRFTDVLRQTPGVTIIPLPKATTIGEVTPRDSAEAERGWDEAARAGRGRYFTVRIKPGKVGVGARQVLEADDDCVPELFVNGKWWGPIDDASDTGPDTRLLPSEIEALEIYNHVSILPEQFNSGREAEECGVIVVWTKRK